MEERKSSERHHQLPCYKPYHNSHATILTRLNTGVFEPGLFDWRGTCIYLVALQTSSRTTLVSLMCIITLQNSPADALT